MTGDVDLTAGERPGDAPLRLRCSSCRPDRTRPVRRDGDPETVVRCARCGKRHSTDSLVVV